MLSISNSGESEQKKDFFISQSEGSIESPSQSEIKQAEGIPSKKLNGDFVI